MHPLYQFLQKLDAGKCHYTLGRHRSDSILVSITFVGERTEVEVFDDGHMEVSRFRGREDVLGGEEYIMNLIAQCDAQCGLPACLVEDSPPPLTY